MGDLNLDIEGLAVFRAVQPGPSESVIPPSLSRRKGPTHLTRHSLHRPPPELHISLHPSNRSPKEKGTNTSMRVNIPSKHH